MTMFMMKPNDAAFPVKVWLDGEEELEANCREQALHLANLPFVHEWVCLMPDTHAGMGMPIGGVLATDGVIIPNAVGVDIGCGMSFAATDLDARALLEAQTANGNLIQAMIGDIARSIPVGFAHHKAPQPCYTMERALESPDRYERDGELYGLLEAGAYQVGTLGGGNHFIELQRDDGGKFCVMLHSGSRNIGKSICDYFNQLARAENRRWHSSIPDEYRLAFLPADSGAGKRYISWMNLALEFARENREKMMLALKAIINKWAGKALGAQVSYSQELDCHHNYAALERHGGKEVWVHRKGAVRADAGALCVIPGAMGAHSYIALGHGNPESFCSSSHGAGRRYSRKGAMAAFTRDAVLADLRGRGVVLGKTKRSDVAEESRFAYKDIEEVMRAQTDLVTPVRRLTTLGVVKG